MAEIFTPQSLWQDLEINTDFNHTRTETYVTGDVFVEKFFIDGKKTDDGVVKIFMTAFRHETKKCPSLLLLGDYEKSFSDDEAIFLSKNGFDVFTVDYSGYSPKKSDYTIFPPSMEKYNIEKVKDNLFYVGDNAKTSHFYEWTHCVVSAVRYIKSVKDGKIGVLGYKGGGLSVWHLASLKEIDAGGILYNAGWNSYKVGTKFEPEGDGQLDDDALYFSAGIDAQSYASHAKCPILFITATNDKDYDIDRAYDTNSRLNGKVPYVYDYFLGADGIERQSVKNVILFFSGYLGKTAKYLVPHFESDSKIVGDKIVVTLSTDIEQVKDVTGIYLLVSKNQTDPALRTWEKNENYEYFEGKYTFTIDLDSFDKTVYFFGKVKLKNGMVIATSVLNERIEGGKNENVIKSSVIYSGRKEGFATRFLSVQKNITSDYFVEEKSGPMGIKGISVKNGLKTYSVNTPQDMPKDDAILMFDVFANEPSVITVTLVFDIRGKEIRFSAKENLLGGSVWHNVKFEIQNFKTEEGRPLRDYKMLNAIEFYSSGDALINNLLWI